MNLPPGEHSKGPLSRREFVVNCALAGLTAATLGPHRMLGAGAAGNDRCPEELIYRTMTGQLEIIGANGQARRRLEPNRPEIKSWGIGPVFADGRRVILVGYGQGVAWKGQPTTHPFIYDRVSGEFTELALANRPAPYVTVSFLFPGGEQMMIGCQVRGEMLLYTCRLDGSELKPVTQPGQGFTYGEALSPDRQRIAFHAVGMAAGVENRYSIFTADPDGAARTLVDRDEEAYCFGPSWSPDSQWIAYLKCAFKTDPGHDAADIWVARPDGAGKRALTAGHPHLFATGFGRPPHFGNGSNFARWSPVANVITHTRVSPGAVPPWAWREDHADTDHFNRTYQPDKARGGAQLCLINPFSGATSELTPATERRWDFRATWSPAGDKLAFIRADVGAPGQLWVMNSDGSDARFLTSGEEEIGVDHPQFLPRVP